MIAVSVDAICPWGVESCGLMFPPNAVLRSVCTPVRIAFSVGTTIPFGPKNGCGTAVVNPLDIARFDPHQAYLSQLIKKNASMGYFPLAIFCRAAYLMPIEDGGRDEIQENVDRMAP